MQGGAQKQGLVSARQALYQLRYYQPLYQLQYQPLSNFFFHLTLRFLRQVSGIAIFEWITLFLYHCLWDSMKFMFKATPHMAKEATVQKGI